LYPNPTKEFAILNLNSVKGEVNVLVADITGRVVKNITTKATEIKLLKEELGHGLFFVRLTGNNGETRVMKLIVQ
ncbi:MAG: T9SS type A sorting domain-containing protein, partial [Bacteroidota bacterium]